MTACSIVWLFGPKREFTFPPIARMAASMPFSLVDERQQPGASRALVGEGCVEIYVFLTPS